MIKSKSYNITLTFDEIASVEAYQHNVKNKSFCNLPNGASFSASCDGVTVNCISERQSQNLWDAVMLAMPDESE